MFQRVIDRMHGGEGLALIILGFVLLAGTGLFYNFGLGTTVGDETPPLSAALKMIAEHTLRPAYPTFYYLPVAAFAVLPFALLGVFTLPLFGVATNVDAITEFVILNFAQLLPWARLASVCYGALAVYVLYRIARRLFERRETALLSAFFFSTSLLFIQLAHFGRVWSVQLLMIVFTLWAIVRLFDEPRIGRYIISAGGIALSFGINMIGVLVYVPFVVAHALKHRGESFVRTFFLHRDFLLAHALLLVSLLFFYYLNPYGFENYLGFLKKFFVLLDTPSGATQVVSGENTRFCGSGLMSGLIYYPRILIEYELPLLLMAGFGVLFFRRKVLEKRSAATILGSFAVAYIAGITVISAFGINTCEPRYILPVVPILALLSAIFVTNVRERVSKPFSTLVLILAATAALYGPILFDLRLALPETRLLAREWIFAHIPDGARIVSLEETLELPEDETTIRDIQTYAPHFLTKKRAYLLHIPPDRRLGPNYYVLTPSYFRSSIPAELTKERYDYVIVRWWDPEDRVAQMEHVEKLGLHGSLERVARFPDNATDETKSLDLPNNMRNPLLALPSLTQNGPVVDVYRVR
ncbi:MAG: glycosyltransferase family 39 protein [bacterium]|nr:glycosyltransferase family 39 protein [bacterium]